MAAYNRVTRQFQNGVLIDAGDLNAALGDLLVQMRGLLLAAGTGTVTPSSATDALTFPDGTTGTFPDGTPIDF